MDEESPSGLRARPTSRGRHRAACATFAVLAAVAALANIVPERARAQDATGCIDRLSDAEVRARLRFLEHSFRHQRATAIPWYAGWVTFNAVNAYIGWVGFSQAPHGVPRDTWLVNALGASIFVVTSSALPLPGIYGLHRFHRHMRGATPEQRRRTLRRATELLRWAAFVEESNSNAGAHLAAAGWTLASSAYILFRNLGEDPRKISRAVLIQGLTTELFAELTLLSVPRRARRDWEIYRGLACSDPRIGEPDEIPEVGEQHVVMPTPPRGVEVRFGVGLGSLFVMGRF